MKKIFTLVAAVLMVAGLNAQEVGQIDPEALGLTSEAANMSAGTVLAQTENVTLMFGAEEGYKSSNASANGFTTAVVGDVTLDLTKAFTGSNNPKDDGGSNVNGTAVPVTGTFLKFEVKKDGYLYVFHKGNSHKSYIVYEAGLALGYEFAMHTEDVPEAWGNLLSIKVEGDPDNFNLIADPATAIQWPEKLALGDKWEAIAATTADNRIAKSGVSVIKVPVFAEAKDYLVMAAGSKITAAGYIFSETEKDVKITNAEGASFTLMGAGATGIENNVASVVSSRYFLLSGEEVAAPQAGNTGLYIVKNIMSDGSVNVSKIVLK